MESDRSFKLADVWAIETFQTSFRMLHSSPCLYADGRMDRGWKWRGLESRPGFVHR